MGYRRTRKNEPLVIFNRVKKYVEQHPEAPFRAICKAVRGRASTVQEALRAIRGEPRKPKRRYMSATEARETVEMFLADEPQISTRALRSEIKGDRARIGRIVRELRPPDGLRERIETLLRLEPTVSAREVLKRVGGRSSEVVRILSDLRSPASPIKTPKPTEKKKMADQLLCPHCNGVVGTISRAALTDEQLTEAVRAYLADNPTAGIQEVRAAVGGKLSRVQDALRAVRATAPRAPAIPQEPPPAQPAPTPEPVRAARRGRPKRVRFEPVAEYDFAAMSWDEAAEASDDWGGWGAAQ
jgi:hypothetical protein